MPNLKKVEAAISQVTEALDGATRGMSTEDYLEVVGGLIDDFQTRHDTVQAEERAKSKQEG